MIGDLGGFMKGYNNIFNWDRYPKFGKDKRPKEDGPCICLSGEKYCLCCQNLVEKNKTNRKQLVKLYERKEKKLVSKKVYKSQVEKKGTAYCLICNDEKEIRFSHTLSKGIVLKNLCNNQNDYVKCIDEHIMINDNTTPFEERFKDIDIDDASVTVSFCKVHDDEIFGDIENANNKYIIGCQLQNLEYALKAVTYELYSIILEIEYLAALLKEDYAVVYDTPNKSQFFEDYAIKVELLDKYVYFANQLICDIYDEKEGKRTSKLQTLAIQLDYNRVEFSLAEIFDMCMVNVINAPTPFILISYYEDNENKEILTIADTYSKNANLDNLKELTRYIISNAKNIYFNKLTIENLDDMIKRSLYVAHRYGVGVLGEDEAPFMELFVDKFFSK